MAVLFVFQNVVSRGFSVFLAQAQNWPDFNAARLRIAMSGILLIKHQINSQIFYIDEGTTSNGRVYSLTFSSVQHCI